MPHSPYVRARLALAVAARESADLSRGVVGDLSTPMPAGERIRKARRIRLLSLTLVDRAVLAELSEGASWGDVATALGIDADEARRRYEPTWQVWLEGDDAEPDDGDFEVGMLTDPDARGTAEALDSWWRRHAEPWETADAPRPVGQVLVDGETSPGDR